MTKMRFEQRATTLGHLGAPAPGVLMGLSLRRRIRMVEPLTPNGPADALR
jgi:hypothetical protein